MLADARDPHIWLEADGQTIPTMKREVEPNYDMETLRRAVPEWRMASPTVATGRFGDGIGYILIATWDRERRDDLEPAFEALDDFVGGPGLIVDVRPNAGGSETLARHFAGCFVEEPVVYAKHVLCDPGSPDGFTEPHERVLARKKGRPRYRGRVAVLMGPANMSSCEAFLLMMKQVPGCTLVGGTSYGSSGNPQPVGLGNGVTVYLPSWRAMGPDGTTFEGRGIAPDVPVPATEEDPRKGDPVLDSGLAVLRAE
jgi:C-terminal processing protease CtpA/Prc